MATVAEQTETNELQQTLEEQEGQHVQEQQPEAEEQQSQAEEPEEVGSIHDDPLLSSLYEDLGLISKPEEVEIEQVEEPQPEEPEPEPEPEPEQASQDDEPDQPEPEPEEEPKRNKTFEVKPPVTQTDVRDAVREEFEKFKLPQQTPEPEPEPKKPVDSYEETLLDEQRDELALARYAESKMPDKYNKMGKKLLDFYKKLDAYAEKAHEDPDRTLDQNDEEFMRFIEDNKPTISASETKKLEKMMWKEEALEEARKETQKDRQDFERKLHELEARPKINETIKEFESSLPAMVPDEIGDLIRDGGLDKAEKESPYEVSIIKEKIASATNLAKEYLNISNGIKDFDGNNNNHSWLLSFINNQAEYFAKNGGNDLVRQDSYGNKANFVTPTEYAGLAGKGQTSGKWTFTSDDVLKMLGANAIKEAQDTIKTEEERLTRMGFVRQKKSPAAEPKKKTKQAAEAKPITPPKSKSSAGPGAADSSALEESSPVGGDIIDILNMKE